MKNKKIITISLVSILLLSVGCSQHNVKLENDTREAEAKIIKDSSSIYRTRLQSLKNFKRKIDMPFIISKWEDGSCMESKYQKGYNKDKKVICVETKEKRAVPVENSCEDGNGLKKAQEIIEFTENNQNVKMVYSCINTNKKDTKEVTVHAISKDVRYISVGSIVNKSGKESLPTNLDLIVKNTINTIGENYVLIEATNHPKKGEYRIEGAITGFDLSSNKNGNAGGQVYQTGGARGNLQVNSNDNVNIKNLSMDFIIKKYDSELKRWKYVRNVSTSKQIKRIEKQQGNTFTIGLLGGGVSFGNMISTSSGISNVSRVLIENSMVELLAKLDDLPYWSFLPNYNNHYTDEEANWKDKLEYQYDKKIKKKSRSGYYSETFVEQLLNNYYPNKNKTPNELIKDYKSDFEFFGDQSDKVSGKFIVHLLQNVVSKLVQEDTQKKSKTLESEFKVSVK